MGGLAKSDDYDEEELMEELESLAQAADAKEVSQEVAMASNAIVVGIDPALYPKAPSRKRESRQKLLAADSAAC